MKRAIQMAYLSLAKTKSLFGKGFSAKIEDIKIRNHHSNEGGNDMEKEELQGVAFQIIAIAGEARSLVHEAFHAMRNSDFKEAQAKLDAANETLVQAHNAQTELLTAYASGDDVLVEIIMVHAQDHLMTAMTLHETATEMLALYRKIEGKA